MASQKFKQSQEFNEQCAGASRNKGSLL